MRTLTLLLAVTLAPSLAGCGYVRITGTGYTATAVYVLKDPQLDRLTVTARGSRLSDYQSTTRADAISATGNVVVGLAKLIVGIP